MSMNNRADHIKLNAVFLLIKYIYKILYRRETGLILHVAPFKNRKAISKINTSYAII